MAIKYMMYGINQMMEQVRKKCRKSNRTFLTDYGRSLMVSIKSSNERKHDCTHHRQKLNVSRNLCHEENIKILKFFVDNKP